MRPRLPLLLAALASLPATGCGGHACTLSLQDCSLGLTVEGLEAGTYDVTLSLDGRTVRCTAAVPTPDAGSEEAAAVGCEGGVLTVSGEAREEGWPVVPPAADDAFRVRIPSGDQPAPRKVSVAVARDGVTLLSRTVTPRYSVGEPNGEGCGECATARATVRP